jgi:hypothetical protein
MEPVETIPGMEKGRNSSVIYLIHCKIFCGCYNVLPHSTTIKKFRKEGNTLKKKQQKSQTLFFCVCRVVTSN